MRLNDDAAFAIPFCDGYWSRLLNRRYHYEAEIEVFLRSAARDRFFFVDCGANFGYWSVLASSRPFGSQSALAIEASSANAQRLTRNSDLNGNRFRCLNAAVCGENGGFARVVGGRHEKLGTIALAQSEPDCVDTVSLDGLAESGLIDSTIPVVVKLDVEGVEIEALKGGRGLLVGNCLVVCEEHGADRTHAVSRHIANETAMKLGELSGPWASS
ncbi:FkbM family methyltransferase [Bradyrhizobium sp.]|uniref:FkbM family methyltransferase n=1 Tax=Bradyrhizobium sp. TaxID=376 RepID=UPI0025BCA52D|nr:FkbM family methyltransferase [Bradyrhizobium sp.]